jgi:hypothetical protein
MMEEIADEERRVKERQKKTKSSQSSICEGSEIIEDDDYDNYDNMVSKLLLTLLHFGLLRRLTC